MKIIIHSNAPFVGSGYSGQTDIVSRWLKAHGHNVMIAGFHGHTGAILSFNGIPVLPSSMEQWGNDVILAHYDYYRPDVYFILADSWVMKENILDQLPATLWAPVDSTPMSQPVFDALKHVRWPIAMSRHGERQMRYHGLDPLYAPHMVETEVFKPVDRRKARASYGFTDEQYVVVTVASNKGMRKNLDRLVRAWAEFAPEHPNAILYLHTNPLPNQGGADIQGLCEFYGLKAKFTPLAPGENLHGIQVIVPDVYKMIRGDYTQAKLNDLYNAADLFILPSGGEGFGVPVIEAQSASCPVAVSDFTALHELSAVGYRIPIDPVDDVTFTLHNTHQAIPKISEIRKALEWGLENRHEHYLREKARDFAMNYDAERIMTRHLLPALETMAQANGDYHTFNRSVYAKQAQVVEPPDGIGAADNPECREKGHDWHSTGVWDNGDLCAPCRRKECEAELRRNASGWTIREHGFKNEVNGVKLDIEDDPTGGVAKLVMREIENHYDFSAIDFQPGDVVIDIGGHVGIISIYLAKKYPDIHIYAYEPGNENFERLLRNLEANGIANVYAFHKAVTADGRDLVLTGNPAGNSGGLSAFVSPNGHSQSVHSTTLKDILFYIAQDWHCDRVKLLKIDAEGAEFEILQSAGAELARIDHLRGEFHINDRLRAMGCDPAALDQFCEQYIPDVKVNAIEMSQ